MLYFQKVAIWDESSKYPRERVRFIHPSEIEECVSSYGVERGVMQVPTFIECEIKTRRPKKVRDMIYGLLNDLNADALIHYQERENDKTLDAHDEFHYLIYMRGTPVKKV